MANNLSFQLNFIKEEQHLMLPTVSSIRLTQNLYDILFQYVITEEKEQKLKSFIEILEKHIKSKNRAPFSLPVAELEFLENDGLQELKLLNWFELTVAVFRVSIDSCLDKEGQDLELEKIYSLLDDLMIISRKDSDLIYVYPSNLVK